jgi:hypothetical protein
VVRGLFVWKRRTKGSTTLLMRHCLDVHAGTKAKAATSTKAAKSVTIQSAFANASAITADRDTMLDVALAQAIVSSNLTFRSLDNRFLRAFIRLLNSSYQLPHRTLARKLSDKLYFALMREIQGCSGSNFCSGAKPAEASQSQPAGARFCQDYAH